MQHRLVRVWWEGERRWFHGEVAKYERGHGLQVVYTDGDKMWYSKSEYEASMGAAEWHWLKPGDVELDDTKEADRLPPVPPLCGNRVGRMGTG
jgi:hypothetical protein